MFIKRWKRILFAFNFVLWLIGFAFCCIFVWIRLDPRRNYVLRLVDVSEHHPLLNYANFLLVFIGVLIFFVGCFGCCGAFKEVRCVLLFYAGLLAFIILLEITVVLLSIFYYAKFHQAFMADYLLNMTNYRYGRENWVTELMDTIQFYHKCCGYNSTRNYYMSYWQITYSHGLLYNVPASCCKQRPESYPPSDFYPIAEFCQYRPYDSAVQAQEVYTQGCSDELAYWLGQNCLIFVAVCLFAVVFQLFGIFASMRLNSNLQMYYHFIMACAPKWEKPIL